MGVVLCSAVAYGSRNDKCTIHSKLLAVAAAAPPLVAATNVTGSSSWF